MNYGIGLSMIPFASKFTHITGMLIPVKIIVKTKPSRLFIILKLSSTVDLIPSSHVSADNFLPNKCA